MTRHTTRHRARHLAGYLIPDDSLGHNAFFTHVAQQVLGGILLFLFATGEDFTLDDVARVAKDPERVRNVLGLSREANPLLGYLRDPQTTREILAVMQLYLEEQKVRPGPKLL